MTPLGQPIEQALAGLTLTHPFSGSGGGGGGVGPLTAQYLTLVSDSSLTSERVFTPGPGGGLAAVDSGAGAAYTLSVDGTVARSTWAVNTSSGLSGGGPLSAAGLTLAVDATVVRTTRTVATGAGLAGGGDLSANRTLTVDLTYAFPWSGNQTWSGTVTFNNTAAFTSSISSHLIPTATDTYDLGTSLKLWRKGWLAELDAILFAKNVIEVVGGWMILGKDEGTLPADSGTTSPVNFGKAMTVNDFVLFRAAGQVEYMQVLSLSSGTTYNVTRDLDGSGANNWVAGSVFLVLGNTGNGRIELNANATPRISLVTQGATYNAQTELLRAGDLNGNWGYIAETYGLAIGAYGSNLPNITIDSTNGLRIRNNTTVVLQLDIAGNADITAKLRLPGAGSAIAIGATPPTAASAGTGIWIDRTGLYGLLAGTAQVKLDATTGALTAGAGAVKLDATGIVIQSATSGNEFVKFKNGATVVASLGNYAANDLYVNVASGNLQLQSLAGGNVIITAIGGNIVANSDVQVPAGGLSLGSQSGATAGALYMSGTLQMDNNKIIQWRDSGGVARTIMYANTVDELIIYSPKVGGRMGFYDNAGTLFGEFTSTYHNVANPLRLGGSTRQIQMYQYTAALNASTQLITDIAVAFGFVLIEDITDGSFAIAIVRGAIHSSTIVSDPAGTFSAVLGTAGKDNIAWDGASKYVVQNFRASGTHSYWVCFIGLS